MMRPRVVVVVVVVVRRRRRRARSSRPRGEARRVDVDVARASSERRATRMRRGRRVCRARPPRGATARARGDRPTDRSVAKPPTTGRATDRRDEPEERDAFETRPRGFGTRARRPRGDSTSTRVDARWNRSRRAID